MDNIKLGKIIGAVAVILVVGIIALGSFYTVNTGEVAIISKFGKVASIEEAGLHFKIPVIERKDLMEIREKTYYFGKIFDNSSAEKNTKSLEISTKDMQSILIDLSVQASISDPEKLYKAFKMSYEDRFVRP
ncbi:MAG: prohibitin family protein, partial [Fusobacterium sp.]|nr:prohibitin family protein [Fusobacterium sp.]